MDPIIDIRELRKVYPDGTEAVRGITFQVQRGEFFAFLGPNGAGKSTTIKMLITLLPPSGGEARVFGLDTQRDAEAIRHRIGYAAQETGLDDELTGRENLTLQGELYHLPKDELRRRVDMLLGLMDLTQDAERPAGSYSGGMRKRLDLATGLIHSPEILFLDEPTTGLDPQNRANLWTYLERLNKEEGLTIFLTTHYMEEADRLCDRLAIIDHGQLVAEGSPSALKSGLGGDVVALSLGGAPGSRTELLARATARVEKLPGVRGVQPGDSGLNVVVEDGTAAVPALMRALDEDHLPVERLSLSRPTLDDVFLKYTGRSIRAEEPNTKWRNRRGPPWARRRGR